MRIIFLLLPNVISNEALEDELGDGVCFISQVGGGFIIGKAEFLEDCETLDEFETVPQPAEDMFNHHGVQPVVCCPEPVPEDYNEEDYEYNGEYPEDYEYEGYDSDTAVSTDDIEVVWNKKFHKFLLRSFTFSLNSFVRKQKSV